MNTKQLWTALTLNKVTNQYFDGIFSIDTLSEINTKPRLIICNTDPSYKAGQHWVLFFFKDNSVDFYDSLGKDIQECGPEFITFIQNYCNNFKECIGRTQPNNSSLCGVYCLYYSYAKCIGKSMEEIIDEMKNTEKIVNTVKQIFFINSSDNCSLLHNCIEL